MTSNPRPMKAIDALLRGKGLAGAAAEAGGIG
jgi:hypothetical protein